MKPIFLCLLLATGSTFAVEPVSRPDPARFTGEIDAFAKQEPKRGGIVFTGSSSFRLWANMEQDFPDLPVTNRGFGGSIANDLTTFFETVVARHEPKLIVTYTGTNDLNAKLGVQATFGDYTNFLTVAHERFPRARIIITSVKIAPSRVQQIPQVSELNDRLLTWSVGKSWVRYVDCTSYLADPAGQPIASYYREDMLHLNPSGYAKWKTILDPVLHEEWTKANPAP
ncbi:MAG: GDSL-type esterase/lipase family protein [Luteolibacter sp.]